MDNKTFNYRTGERFADIEILRYRLNGWEHLTLNQKKYIFCLSKATLYGRDITFDQFGQYNLKIRRTLEVIWMQHTEQDEVHASAGEERHREEAAEWEALEEYLKRIWFSNGIYHHYGCEKFVPAFSSNFLWQQIRKTPAALLPLEEGDTKVSFYEEISPYIFSPERQPKRVNKADGEDLVTTSAVTFYQGVSQREAEEYYASKKAAAIDDPEPESFGLNSTLLKGVEMTLLNKPDVSPWVFYEERWCATGKYGAAIRKIVYWLEQASQVAENEKQREVIRLLCEYYRTGSLKTFNEYCKAWVTELNGQVDFVNGFIEVYNDPLGLKGSWEGIVEYVDQDATHRAEVICSHAQWFEDHSPVDPRFRKAMVKGVSARVVRAAMLGGDEYPSTAIGINLPNADWLRAEYGSKSVTISNLTEAYDKAAHGNGFREEFVIDSDTLQLIERYGDQTDDLHTDLHECLGHGSGQLLPGTDPDALRAYGNTIEEARADLFALYYMADEQLVALGLLPDTEAYKACYYTYLMNGAMTQLTRIQPGHQIEEAHMRNRALIAHWVLEHAGTAAQLTKRQGKTFLQVSDYAALRPLFGTLLREIQRIKSEGDYEAARLLVEQYGIKVDPSLHEEVRQRYVALHLAPYKGFLNPRLLPQRDSNGHIVDITVDYSETYTEQMLRYSMQYGTLITPR